MGYFDARIQGIVEFAALNWQSCCKLAVRMDYSLKLCCGAMGNWKNEALDRGLGCKADGRMAHDYNSAEVGTDWLEKWIASEQNAGDCIAPEESGAIEKR